MYIHIPFCKRKCNYCSFYSFEPTESLMDEYLQAVLTCIDRWSKKDLVFDTVYFGGGTPSVFGGQRIAAVLSSIKKNFSIPENAEITVECNPSSVDQMLAETLASSGVNRVSMGMQSAVESERKALGRLSGKEQVKKSIDAFQNTGITNISLDLMLGIPGQTPESLNESLRFAVQSGAKHISAYMLKLEEGTPLLENKNDYSFPDEDLMADMYLKTVAFLKSNGFEQYEVSNFAIPGFESRHNLKYWKCEEYLGIGPSAHSFIGGKRFYYPNDFNTFLNGCEPVDDGEGGTEEEYVMLSLRLRDGLADERFFGRFGRHLPEKLIEKAKQIEKYGYISIKDGTIVLNPEGFLISNSIITELTEEL